MTGKGAVATLDAPETGRARLSLKLALALDGERAVLKLHFDLALDDPRQIGLQDNLMLSFDDVDGRRPNLGLRGGLSETGKGFIEDIEGGAKGG